jgi:putative protease
MPQTSSVSTQQRVKPEILAPAGTKDAMIAAVENGADAVYFGLQQFNARLRAANFTMEDLPRTMEYLHERGVKGYITMNTLVFPAELEDAVQVLRGASAAGVDAILVQDLGLAWLANQLVPDLPIHSSTQMTITNAEGVRALDALGLRVERIVAAREMNREELKQLRAGIDKEVEVFVHGALCVAYSGQCLTSEALGGRSANRGECAQACRLPYDLMVDGEQRPLGDVKYLLSPKDLSAFEDIDDLMDAGIASLKIEGRLKTPHYVAATVQSYRAAVEVAFHGEKPRVTPEIENKLAMTFSRGFTGGYLHATDHQVVVEGRFPKKRGLYLGRVTDVKSPMVEVELEHALKPGDGVVFDSGEELENEPGGTLFYLMDEQRRALKEYRPRTGETRRLWLEFGAGRINLRRINVNDRLWKTSDPHLEKELEASYSEGVIHHRRPVHAKVSGAVGEPLQLTLADEQGHSSTVWDESPAEEARKHPLTMETLRSQLERMGNTPFELGTLEVSLQGSVMVPVSRLNELRRKAVEALLEKRRTAHKGRRENKSVLLELTGEISKEKAKSIEVHVAKSRLSVLCRTLEQVEAAVAFHQQHGDGLECIYTEFEDVRNQRQARALIPSGGPLFVPATLRILKPGENPYARILLKSEPDALLIRSLSGWELFRHEAPHIRLIGDFSLNISNQLSAKLLKDQGIWPLTPSYDLNIDQLLDLLRVSPSDWYEVTLHQYMPMFHMEHCVFCRFLSTGTNEHNCGRPCEKHEIKLRDRVGFEHPVKADAGCRNTVFNATAQSASAYMGALHQAGVRRFRVDMLLESGDRLYEILSAYRPVVLGERDGSHLWRELKASSKLGVTRGSLDHE